MPSLSPSLSPSPLGADADLPSSFADLGVPAPFVELLARRGITRPLPIQAATIADALAGRDICGRAPTGSGKTLACGIPLAANVARAASGRPRGLVLVPTRELASQVTEELTPLLALQKRRAHAIFGGVGFGAQLAALRRGVDVLVACPGRLEDLVARRSVDLADVDVVVVDEADRMADMGFLPAVRRILDATSATRQTQLFSATLDGEIDVLVRRYQHDPARHEVAGDPEEIGRADHEFRQVTQEERVKVCAELARSTDSSIIFVRTKHGADRLATQLGRQGLAVQAIHGGRSQQQRERALAAFRAGSAQALVATDVAARGIHVDNVSTVIHYDLPADPKDYVHRSGRTARAGASGSVVALVVPEQVAAAKQLRHALDPRAGGLERSPAATERQAGDSGGGRSRAGRRRRFGAQGARPPVAAGRQRPQRSAAS